MIKGEASLERQPGLHSAPRPTPDALTMHTVLTLHESVNSGSGPMPAVEAS
jgi:hypothetical protein